MNKPLSAWQKVLIFLFLGIVLIVAPLVWPGKIPAVVLPLSVWLGFYLILEALAQPDPSAKKTPLYQLIGRYTNRQDRFVAGISFGVAILAILLAGILLEDVESINWIVKSVLTLLVTIGSYFAIGLYFGSQEFRDSILPKGLRRFWEKRNQNIK